MPIYRYFIASQIPNFNIISTKYEPIPAVTMSVGEGDDFQLGSLKVSHHTFLCGRVKNIGLQLLFHAFEKIVHELSYLPYEALAKSKP
jgi:hypothetical protein